LHVSRETASWTQPSTWLSRSSLHSDLATKRNLLSTLCLNFLTLLFNYSSGSSSSLFLPCTIISRWARFFVLERLRHRSYAIWPIFVKHISRACPSAWPISLLFNSISTLTHSHSELGLEPLAEVVFQPPSLWPEGISFSPMPLLYPVQHHEPSNELTQGTAKTLASRQEIPDLCSAPG